MTIKERRTPTWVKEFVCRRAGGIWNPESKICTGGKCEICGGKKFDPLHRGLKLMHKKRRKMGGTTDPEIHSPENCFRACFVCDEENDGERLPRTKVSDAEESRMAALTGHYHGEIRAVSIEMQVGEREK